MALHESYPCYVQISDNSTDEIIELPTEKDGTMLLSTITAQFPDAIGLRFKGDNGVWRGVRVTDGVLDIPLEGWRNLNYFVTNHAIKKRKAAPDIIDYESPKVKKETFEDLIVMGLPYTSTEDDLKKHFSKFGKLAHWEIKKEKETKKSKGYGFIRFLDSVVIDKVITSTHTIGGRKCDVQFPRRGTYEPVLGAQDGIPTKLFVGRLPNGATTSDLKDVFADYGPIKEVYIPNNFRNFGFVTFPSQFAADAAINSTHKLKGSTLNLTYPTPKGGEQSKIQAQSQHNYQQQPSQQYQQVEPDQLNIQKYLQRLPHQQQSQQQQQQPLQQQQQSQLQQYEQQQQPYQQQQQQHTQQHTQQQQHIQQHTQQQQHTPQHTQQQQQTQQHTQQQQQTQQQPQNHIGYTTMLNPFAAMQNYMQQWHQHMQVASNWYGTNPTTSGYYTSNYSYPSKTQNGKST